MKKTLALVLIVVMSIGLAVPASAASALYADGSTFTFTIDGGAAPATSTSFSATGPLATVTSGSVILIQDIRAYVGDGISSQLLTNDEYTLSATIIEGGSYGNAQENNVNKQVALTVTNHSPSSKTVTVRLTLSPVPGGASNLSQPGSFTASFTVTPAATAGSTYDLAWANGGVFPLGAANPAVTLPVGSGVNEFSAIDAAVIPHLRNIAGGRITAQGSGYELAFAAETVGTTSGAIDIDGQVGVPNSFLQAYPDVPSVKLTGIYGIASNSAIATFTLLPRQDFLDLCQGNPLYVYDLNGNLTNYQAHWSGTHIVFEAPVGSYVVNGSNSTLLSPQLVDVSTTPTLLQSTDTLTTTVTTDRDNIVRIGLRYRASDDPDSTAELLGYVGSDFTRIGPNTFQHTSSLVGLAAPQDRTLTLFSVYLWDDHGYEAFYALNPTAERQMPLTVHNSYTIQVAAGVLDTDTANPVLSENLTELAQQDNSATSTITYSSDNATLPADVFSALHNTDMTVTAQDASSSVQWVWHGEDITNPSYSHDLDLTTTVSPAATYTGAGSSDIDTVVSDAADAFVVSFANNGTLPGRKTLIRLKADAFGLSVLGNTGLRLYYYNETSRQFQPITPSPVLADDGYYEFWITHNSGYILTNSVLNLNQLNTSDGEWITVYGDTSNSGGKSNPHTGA